MTVWAGVVNGYATIDRFRDRYQQDWGDPAGWPSPSGPSRPDLAEPPAATLASIVAELEETARIQKETAELLCELARSQGQSASQSLRKAQDLLQRLGAMQISVPAQPGLGDRRPRRPASQGWPGRPGKSLTAQEEAVLRLLATSRSLGEISQHMHLSRNTIKSHTRAIYRKLGATSRREAVQRGYELALLPRTRALLKTVRD